jgi:Protein of unknown function (DUF3467)
MPKHTDKPETKEGISDQGEGLNVSFVSSEVSAIYSNFVQLTVTPFDIGIRFAQLVYDSPTPTAKEVARVIISPETAKAVMILLQRQITSYETAHGKIPQVIKTDADIARIAP